jgi:hypothetical protein
VLKRTNLDNASVVDQNVDLPEAIDDLTNSRLNLAAIEQVALNSLDCATARSEISFCPRQFVRVPCNEANTTALRANVSRKHEPESA